MSSRVDRSNRTWNQIQLNYKKPGHLTLVCAGLRRQYLDAKRFFHDVTKSQKENALKILKLESNKKVLGKYQVPWYNKNIS